MKRLGFLLLFSFILAAIIVVPWECYRNVRFEQDIEGHLKRAADSNQPALAIQELDTALTNMDEWGLCDANDPRRPDDCYTSVFWRTPDEDVGFWRANIEQTIEDLDRLPAEADHLTVSNTLMKVRETLLDGDKIVTLPPGADIYPYNKAIGWLLLITGALGLIGDVLLLGAPSRPRDSYRDDTWA